MRHHSSVKKFGREKNQRNALMRSLARNIIRDSRIRTTLAKAKALRPFVEKMITRAKTDTVSNRRLLTSRLGSPVEVTKLFKELGPKYVSRKGGFTRIIKLPNRDLDGSPMAFIEFV